MRLSRRNFLIGILSILMLAPVSARMGRGGVPTASGPAPVLLYTDIVSGSATNGEFGEGSYLTLYGMNLGSAANMCTAAGAQVTIGGAPVANCRYLVPAKTNGIRPGFPAIYALNVQIGSAAVQALTPGTTYTIGLTVNGVAANTTDVLGNPFNFVIQPGHFYFVDTVNGNDATGVVDDITHPFRYVQNANGGTTFTGVWAPGKFGPGDTIVIRGNGGTPISDQVGYDGRLMRYYNQGGTAPTGAIGNGYEAFTSYPGPINGNAPEDVYILIPAGGRGGFMGVDTVHARPNANDGQYWTASNMRSSCDLTTGGHPSDASNFNLQNSADFTRFVNLDVQWPSPDVGLNTHEKAGGIVGNGHHVEILGNYIHNISGGDPSALENHGVYLDGSNTDAAEVEVGFNVIVNCETGQCIQFHSEASDGFANAWVHHNWAENSAKYDVKIDGFSGLFWMWDNVVVGSVRDGFGFENDSNAGGSTSGFVGHVENNTFFNNYSTTVGPQGVLVNEGQTSTLLGTIDFSNNVLAYGPGTSGYTAQYTSFSGAAATLHGNVYYDYSGRLTSKPAADTTGVYGNPQFLNTATFPNFDPRIGATSIAIGRAVAATINPVNDYGMNPQPRAGQSVRSVGAAQ